MNQAATVSDIRIRPMTAGDLADAHALCRAVQWPHRQEDWAFNLAQGQGLVAERDGTVVGTGMCWLYGDAAATLGMVIVAPELQGTGIGKRLMSGLLDILQGRTVFLNATAAGLKLYESLGFEAIGRRIHQHQGAAFSVPVIAPGPGERLRPIGRGDTAALIALDSAATGMDRTQLITSLLDEAEGLILDRDGEPAGFALFRRFGRGHAIGPVVAQTVDGAKALIAHWLASRHGMFIRIDVPDDSGLTGWLEELGLAGVGPVETMRRGQPLADHRSPRGWAIVSQALG